jgi:hypothetical protein
MQAMARQSWDSTGAQMRIWGSYALKWKSGAFALLELRFSFNLGQAPARALRVVMARHGRPARASQLAVRLRTNPL